MTRFLFASIPIEGHSASPLSIMDRLLSTGHDVTWLSGAAYAGRAARLGVRHVPLDRWTDLSSFDDPFDAFPHLRGLRGAKLIRTGFRDVFVAEAAGQLHDIEAALEDFPADVIVADGLVFGARLAAERHGIPYAGIGDGPYAITDPEVPPFGPGLRRWPGAVGRLRNRALYAVSRRFFADVNAELTRVRVEHGFPREHPWVFDEMAAGDLYLQGSVPGFEYPIEHLPANVRFVGALRPPIPSDWVPPRWWRDLDGSWPVVHVTQGTIRPDPTELLLPTMEALADEDVLVVATTGGCDPSELGPLPPNARAESFIPYELLLARASAFVTNGGFIGTNLALHHGVPVIQVGRTEEKAEIGARIEHAGVGLRFGRRPSARRLRDAVHYVLTDRTVRANVEQLSEQYQLHDAPTEAAALLVELASARGRAQDIAAAQDIAERSTLPA